jgi:hypothetical protein
MQALGVGLLFIHIGICRVSLRCGPPFADRQDQGRFCFAAAVMRSVHKFSYGHKFERTAATPVVA